jgi:hypothetical protein
VARAGHTEASAGGPLQRGTLELGLSSVPRLQRCQRSSISGQRLTCLRKRPKAPLPDIASASEPAISAGTYRWKCDRRGAGVDVEIWRYPDAWRVGSEADGSLEMHAECTVLAMCRAISVAAHSVLDVHGVDGYHMEWVQAAFPVSDLAQLDSLIAQQDS